MNQWTQNTQNPHFLSIHHCWDDLEIFPLQVSSFLCFARKGSLYYWAPSLCSPAVHTCKYRAFR
jgi:hypothetical protein